MSNQGSPVHAGQVVWVKLWGETRRGVVLFVAGTEVALVIGGSTKDYSSPSIEVPQGSPSALQMGLSQTTYFCLDGVQIFALSSIEPHRGTCPRPLFVKLCEIARSRMDALEASYRRRQEQQARTVEGPVPAAAPAARQR